jgi:hypothetical protein
MKVAAVFQIYFPYFLPRTPEWSTAENLQFQFEVNGHMVDVHPRKQDEELFPRPIDKELAESSLDVMSDYIVPVGAPVKISVRDLCYDRIEAHVYGEVGSPNECMTKEFVWKFLALAVSGCNDFIYHCRVAGRDPAIKELFWQHSFDERAYYFSNPYSVTWYNEADRQPLYSDDKQLMQAASASIRSPQRKPVELAIVEQSIRGGIQPNLTTSLLINAEEHLMLDQLREAIIDLASACEIAATRYIDRKGMDTDPQVERILAAKRQHSFAERNYHLVPTHIDSRSLKTDESDAFEQVEKAYRTRNKLAHTGELVYRDDSGTAVAVTRDMAIKFYEGCKRAVEWIEKL